MTEKKRRPRAGNREGRVYQRNSDGRWVGVVYPPPALGLGPQYAYGKTREEAIENRKKKDAELQAATPGQNKLDTELGDYLKHWVETRLTQDVAAGNLADSTLESYRDNVRLHIVPHLGRITLANLTVPRIRQWQNDLLTKQTQRTQPKPRPAPKPRKNARKPAPPPKPQKPLSVRTVNYCRAILHRALADAIKDEVWGLESNVVDKVDAPGKRRSKKNAPTFTPVTVEEARALYAAMAADKYLWCYWLVLFGMGLRRGEGLGLLWPNVDFADQRMHVEFQVQRKRSVPDPDTGRRTGKLVLVDLKTESSDRKLPMPQAISEALQRWHRQQAKRELEAVRWLNKDLVFTTSAGTALEPRNMNRAWAAVCERAGTRHIKLHDLRHACGTFLAAGGAQLTEIQGWLGHSRASTTEIYVHLLEEMSRDSADRVDRLFGMLGQTGEVDL